MDTTTQTRSHSTETTDTMETTTTTDKDVYFFIADESVRQGAIEAGTLQEALPKLAELVGVEVGELVGLSYYRHSVEKAAEIKNQTDGIHDVEPIKEGARRREVTEEDVTPIVELDEIEGDALTEADTSITYPATQWVRDGADTIIARREVGGDVGAYTLARQEDTYYLINDLGVDQIGFDQTDLLREAVYYLTHDLDTGRRQAVEIVDEDAWEMLLQQIDEA